MVFFSQNNNLPLNDHLLPLLLPKSHQPIHAMDSSSSQRQQHHYPPRSLQGPRPAPLSINKESVKIKKPTPALAPAHSWAAAQPPTSQQQQQQQPRGPVIIYTVSPKAIHVKPGEFMSLVQRLTGVNSSASDVAAASTGASTTPLSCPTWPSPRCALSPAARLATLEKVQQGSDHYHTNTRPSSGDLDIIDQFDDHTGGVSSSINRSSNFPGGILSPNPSSLPTVPPNFFASSGAPELNSLSFLHDMMSPAVPGKRNYMDGHLWPVSPSLLATPSSASPNWDSFKLFQNL